MKHLECSQSSLPDDIALKIASLLEGWKSYYIKKHNEMADRVAEVVEFVRRSPTSESIQVGDYLRAIDNLHSMQLGFKDVQLNFFNPKLNALLNLVGLHYCIKWLQVQAEKVLEALECSRISDRQVSVRWWKVGRRFYGFRMRDESHCCRVSLADLATERGDEVLGVLHRGAIHEVLQVQISVADCSCSPWFC
ncbi:hypothetical protein FEM48_Zijuj12G0183500 [Ziziphus jujuba var. spinosa]|uniref:Uncharacterized protein n=1 Tax=Ziziphus jujuba var. spinosa TaxID=714518 RepID=A0A978UET8_ZIZJJ|nr:hypothetical protein FEM48_Zijuj12G0183500 [Ziziphus jujuba var. spinosa]